MRCDHCIAAEMAPQQQRARLLVRAGRVEGVCWFVMFHAHFFSGGLTAVRFRIGVHKDGFLIDCIPAAPWLGSAQVEHKSKGLTG
jgi:hypothetical protein